MRGPHGPARMATTVTAMPAQPSRRATARSTSTCGATVWPPLPREPGRACAHAVRAVPREPGRVYAVQAGRQRNVRWQSRVSGESPDTTRTDVRLGTMPEPTADERDRAAV